jgi:hypothetical protein
MQGGFDFHITSSSRGRRFSAVKISIAQNNDFVSICFAFKNLETAMLCRLSL